MFTSSAITRESSVRAPLRGHQQESAVALATSSAAASSAPPPTPPAPRPGRAKVSPRALPSEPAARRRCRTTSRGAAPEARWGAGPAEGEAQRRTHSAAAALAERYAVGAAATPQQRPETAGGCISLLDVVSSASGQASCMHALVERGDGAGLAALLQQFTGIDLFFVKNSAGITLIEAALAKADFSCLRAIINHYVDLGVPEIAEWALTRGMTFALEAGRLTDDGRYDGGFGFATAWLSYCCLSTGPYRLELLDPVQTWANQRELGKAELEPFLARLKEFLAAGQETEKTWVQQARRIATIYNDIQAHVCPNLLKIFSMAALKPLEERLRAVFDEICPFLFQQAMGLELLLGARERPRQRCLDMYGFHVAHFTHLVKVLFGEPKGFTNYDFYERQLRGQRVRQFDFSHMVRADVFGSVNYAAFLDAAWQPEPAMMALTQAVAALEGGGPHKSLRRRLCDIERCCDAVWSLLEAVTRDLEESTWVSLGEGAMVVERGYLLLKRLEAYAQAVTGVLNALAGRNAPPPDDLARRLFDKFLAQYMPRLTLYLERLTQRFHLGAELSSRLRPVQLQVEQVQRLQRCLAAPAPRDGGAAALGGVGEADAGSAGAVVPATPEPLAWQLDGAWDAPDNAAKPGPVGRKRRAARHPASAAGAPAVDAAAPAQEPGAAAEADAADDGSDADAHSDSDGRDGALAWHALRQRLEKSGAVRERVHLLQVHAAALLPSCPEAIQRDILTCYLSTMQAMLPQLREDMYRSKSALETLTRCIGEACGKFTDKRVQYSALVRTMGDLAAEFGRTAQLHGRSVKQGRQLFAAAHAVAHHFVRSLARPPAASEADQKASTAALVEALLVSSRLCVQSYQQGAAAVSQRIGVLQNSIAQHFTQAQQVLDEQQRAAILRRMTQPPEIAVEQAEAVAARQAGRLGSTLRVAEVKQELWRVRESISGCVASVMQELEASGAVAGDLAVEGVS